MVNLAFEEPPARLIHELIYCRFPLYDGPGNPPWLLRAAVETVAALLRSGPTLIGCGAGLSRSPCIAGTAIAEVRGCPADEGLALAVRVRAGRHLAGAVAEVRQVLE